MNGVKMEMVLTKYICIYDTLVFYNNGDNIEYVITDISICNTYCGETNQFDQTVGVELFDIKNNDTQLVPYPILDNLLLIGEAWKKGKLSGKMAEHYRNIVKSKGN